MGDVIDTSPTIGSNVEEITFKNLKFVMWDIGGQVSSSSSYNLRLLKLYDASQWPADL